GKTGEHELLSWFPARGSATRLRHPRLIAWFGFRALRPFALSRSLPSLPRLSEIAVLPFGALGVRGGLVEGDVEEVGALTGRGVDEKRVGAGLQRVEPNELGALIFGRGRNDLAVGIAELQLVINRLGWCPVRGDQHGSDGVARVADFDGLFIVAVGIEGAGEEAVVGDERAGAWDAVAGRRGLAEGRVGVQAAGAVVDVL